MITLDPQVLLLVIGAVVALLSKYVWDRYLKQTSRVTKQQFDEAIDRLKQECELKRAPCIQARAVNKAHFEDMISRQKSCLEEAFEEEELVAKRRQDTRRALICIMMTQLKLCEAMNQLLPHEAKKLDCTDISKLMIEMGVIE